MGRAVLAPWQKGLGRLLTRKSNDCRAKPLKVVREGIERVFVCRWLP